MKARTVRVLFGPVEQVLVQKGGHSVQDLCLLTAKRAIHSLHRFQRATAEKDREQTEQPLFLDRQEVIAPGDGLTQGVLAIRQIPRPAG